MLICVSDIIEGWLERLKKDEEQYGVLFGQIYAGNKYCLVIDGAILIDGFADDNWAALLERQREIYPDKKILGWFMSTAKKDRLGENERRIHRLYFNEPWQIKALVNPLTKEQHIFIGEEEIGFYVLNFFDNQKRLELLEEKTKERRKHSFRRKVFWWLAKAFAICFMLVAIVFGIFYFYTSYQDLLGANFNSTVNALWQGIKAFLGV